MFYRYEVGVYGKVVYIYSGWFVGVFIFLDVVRDGEWMWEIVWK